MKHALIQGALESVFQRKVMVYWPGSPSTFGQVPLSRWRVLYTAWIPTHYQSWCFVLGFRSEWGRADESTL